VAANDDEKVAMERMQDKNRFAGYLHNIFAKGDTSGDGVISKSEFEQMIKDKRVLNWFKKLDLGLEEVRALFTVLSADDGVAHYEEFLAGAMKLKGSARTMDTVQILHHQQNMRRELHTQTTLLMAEVQRGFELIASSFALPPEGPPSDESNVANDLLVSVA